jgi:peptidoglycan hydrolase CwlO-like protein
MELHELLGRAKTDCTMALSYLETALGKVEEKQEQLATGSDDWEGDMLALTNFISALEEAICDLKHDIPLIQSLMEDL